MDIDPGDDRSTHPAADEQLARRLARMFAADDAPPADVVELAKLSFGLRAVDAELAALTADSATDSAALAVRAGGYGDEPRLLTFETAGLAIEVEVSAVGGRRRLLGQLIPPGPAVVEVRQTAAPATPSVHADAQGRFVVEQLEPGPISLTCHRAGHRSVATEWTGVD